MNNAEAYSSVMHWVEEVTVVSNSVNGVGKLNFYAKMKISSTYKTPKVFLTPLKSFLLSLSLLSKVTFVMQNQQKWTCSACCLPCQHFFKTVTFWSEWPRVLNFLSLFLHFVDPPSSLNPLFFGSSRLFDLIYLQFTIWKRTFWTLILI